MKIVWDVILLIALLLIGLERIFATNIPPWIAGGLLVLGSVIALAGYL